MWEKLNYKNLLDTSQSIAEKVFFDVVYPWDVIPKIKDFILSLGDTLSKNEYQMIRENVWVHRDAKISHSAYIEGPSIIQKNAQIRHCAFIRGSVIVGENAVIGNSTELKNCILFNNVQVPHFNYVGDSILGYKVHFGAGSIVSNVKSDKSNVSVRVDSNRVDTGLRKFGAIVGDCAEIGCNAVLNPGTIIGRNSVVYPATMVRGVVENNTIFKSTDNIVRKI